MIIIKKKNIIDLEDLITILIIINTKSFSKKMQL